MTSSISRRRFLTVTGAAAGAALFQPVPSPAFATARTPLGDVVVLLPGIMGSVLRKDNRDVWAMSGGALVNALRTLGGSVADLTLKGDSADREDLGDGIRAERLLPDTHLIPGLWKIDGYSKISRSITDTFDAEPGRNFFEFPYDWRRDNRAAARRLARLSHDWLKRWRDSSGHRNAKLILIAHSMGGLVSRYFLEVLGGWRDTRMLITFGTPYRGSLNALSFLANGISKQVGPLTLFDLSALVRSFTSVDQLLPIYPCFDPGNGRLVRVGETSGIPNVDAARAASALAFHNEIRSAVEHNAADANYRSQRYSIHPIVGTYQQTLQLGRLAGGKVEVTEVYPGETFQGDGTVPQPSATPIEPDELTRQHKIVYVVEVHGSLQNSPPMLDHVRGLLETGPGFGDGFRAANVIPIGLAVEDVYSADEPVVVRVRCGTPDVALTAAIMDAPSNTVISQTALPPAGAEERRVDLGRLNEGTYRVRISGDATVASVTDVIVVWRP